MAGPLVLFVSHSSHMYGAERSLLTLATALRDRGQYVPAVLLPRQGPLAQAFEAERIAVRVMPFYHWIGVGHRWLRTPVSATLNRLALSRVPKSFDGVAPALIYTNTLATPFGAQLARRRGLPHVWHVREFVEEDMGAEFDFGLGRSLRFVDRSSARVICNSGAVQRKVAPFIDNGRLRVIHNAVAFSDDEPDLDGRFARTVTNAAPARLVIAGSIHPGKGQEDAIGALARLRADGHDVRLDIVGSGEEKELARLRALAASLAVADAIEWTGYVDDVHSLLTDAAAVLVCSRCEAFGRVAVEAMAAGAPVVAANAGGLPEIVSAGETGLLYPPGDVDALTAAVTRILSDGSLHCELAHAGFRSATLRFGVETHVSGVEAVLGEAINAQR